MKTIFTTILLYISVSLHSQFVGLSNVNGTVSCSAIDSSNGNIYIGGYLPTLGNLARSTDGGLTFQSIANVDDTIFDMKFFQNDLWFGGCFDTVNGIATKFIARYKPTNSSISKVKLDFRLNGGGVEDIEIAHMGIFGYPADNFLFICGKTLRLTTAPTSSCIYFYSPVDSSFKALPRPSFDLLHSFSSNKMTTDGNVLYVYDAFGVGGSNGGLIYEFDSVWTAGWRGGFSNSYYPTDMKWYNNAIYLTGNTGVYKDGASNLVDTAKSYKSMALWNNALYFGGRNLTKYDTSFTTVGVTNSVITHLLPFGNNIYIAGSYTTINGLLLKNISKFQAHQLPNAGFIANTTSFCGNGTVNFTNNSSGTGITSYQWHFPGGNITTSSALNPVVTYSVAGSFDVRLIVFNPAGPDTFKRTNYITINEIPQQPVITQEGDSLISSSATGNQWIYGGTDISNAANQVFWPSQNGSYQVKYTDVNGCSNTSDSFSFVQDTIVSGLNKLSLEKVLAYPNPVIDFVTVTSTEGFKIFDTVGNLFGAGIGYADLRELPTGTYYIEMKSGRHIQIVKK